MDTGLIKPRFSKGEIERDRERRNGSHESKQRIKVNNKNRNI